ncbi:hypothetical protein EOL96_02345 [Candidatus Saccharibacteria bacterium]|nr:hypothetical protein [Candidatus Saccharibacteria bacterium]
MSSPDTYDSFAIEQSCKDYFGVVCDIDKFILHHAPVGKSARATVFLTKKKQLYCYIDGPAKLTLSDVTKIASRMGIKVETFFPPKGRPHYFDEIGRQKFSSVFPGRKDVHKEDLVFYRTLAPYSPALLAVTEVKAGVLYQADSDAHSGWRQAAKFTYRRIKTS